MFCSQQQKRKSKKRNWLILRKFKSQISTYFVLELVDFFALIVVKILFIVLDNVLDKAEKTIIRLLRKEGIATYTTIYCSL